MDDINNLRGQANIGTINMVSIQRHLESNPWIESSTSYIDLDGTLCINLKEYNPVLRIFDKNGRSVYLTEDGISIPTNRLYTPHVLVANGSFALRNDSTSYPLNDTIAEDQALSRLCTSTKPSVATPSCKAASGRCTATEKAVSTSS